MPETFQNCGREDHDNGHSTPPRTTPWRVASSRRVRRSALTITATTLLLFVMNAPGSANASPDSYVNDLRSSGINVDNPAGAIADGYKVCEIWNSHRVGLSAIVPALQHDNPGLNHHDADLEIRAAFHDLCPEALQN